MERRQLRPARRGLCQAPGRGHLAGSVGPACPQLRHPAAAGGACGLPRPSGPPPRTLQASPALLWMHRGAPRGCQARRDRSFIPMALACGSSSASAGSQVKVSTCLHGSLSSVFPVPGPFLPHDFRPSHPHLEGPLAEAMALPRAGRPRQSAPRASPSRISLLASRGVRAALGNRPLPPHTPSSPRAPSPSSASGSLGRRGGEASVLFSLSALSPPGTPAQPVDLRIDFDGHQNDGCSPGDWGVGGEGTD